MAALPVKTVYQGNPIDPLHQPVPTEVVTLHEEIQAQALANGGMDAGAYGFSVTNTATENNTALQAAITAAAGGRIFVRAASDFQCETFTVGSESLDIEFIGNGSWDCSVSGDKAIFHHIDFTNVANITGITETTLSVNGSTVSVTEISVANESPYVIGSVIKIVADDLDPNNDDANARIGEFAPVLALATGKVYLAGSLRYTYTTSPRIGLLPKYKSRIWGLKIKSALTNETSSLVSLQCGYYGQYNIEVIDGHGRIAINHKSGYMCDFVDCKFAPLLADSASSLGYGINDTSSHGTKIIRPKGKSCRHVTTTNHDGTTVLGDLLDYGACYKHTVIDGFADGAQGSPWDEHEGCEGTRWINCEAFRGANNTSAFTAAFQVRGIDAQIINGVCDDSYEAFVRVNSQASGTIHVVNPLSFAEMVLDTSAVTAGQNLKMLWSGGRAEANNASKLMHIAHTDLTLSAGAKISNLALTRGSPSLIEMDDSTIRLDGPVLEMRSSAGTANSLAQFFDCEGSAANKIVGRAFLQFDDLVDHEALIDEDATATLTVDVDFIVEEGSQVPVFVGTITQQNGSVHWVEENILEALPNKHSSKNPTSSIEVEFTDINAHEEIELIILGVKCSNTTSRTFGIQFDTGSGYSSTFTISTSQDWNTVGLYGSVRIIGVQKGEPSVLESNTGDTSGGTSSPFFRVADLVNPLLGNIQGVKLLLSGGLFENGAGLVRIIRK